mgnify:CR=1 FL=1
MGCSSIQQEEPRKECTLKHSSGTHRLLRLVLPLRWSFQHNWLTHTAVGGSIDSFACLRRGMRARRAHPCSPLNSPQLPCSSTTNTEERPLRITQTHYQHGVFNQKIDTTAMCYSSAQVPMGPYCVFLA